MRRKIIVVHFFSIWGQIIPQSFVIPAQWENLKEYATEFDKKHDNYFTQASFLRFSFSLLLLRYAFKKKIAEKETLVHTGGRGVKKIPLF